ncbi:hypothetical protein OG369_42640 [Streptomyces sp. NBC_01221]|uniref:hypothetical protein n=1 Tax=Streptomyces sp. NBC_01221 TaxID=2903782 RepID=UPI0022508EF3|nr:hypothetical protein [Streptomyces sp. NBC_01221]MCX4792476.1 hypothetical protein [Streptomyces sp. NBC_01221]
MDYNQGTPSTSAECACEAERLLNQADRSNDVGRERGVAAAAVWANLSIAAAQREASK